MGPLGRTGGKKMFDWVGTTEALVVAAMVMSVIIIFLSWRKRMKRNGGWYRRGADGANAKAHYFGFGGKHMPFLSFVRDYSLCRRKYLDPLGNWERIEDPCPRIICKVYGFKNKEKEMSLYSRAQVKEIEM